MFLDEELSKIYEENKQDLRTCTIKIHDCMVKKLKEPTHSEDFLTKLKFVDNAYRLFCKTHTEFKPEGFREIIKYADKTGKIVKALKW